MKAVLSNRIYLTPKDPEHYSLMETALTYRVESYKDNQPPRIIKNLRRIANGVISIPIGRMDLVPSNYEIKDKRLLIPAGLPEFRGTLRDSQQEILDQLEDNAIINAPVSWGKTFAGIAIAQKLGQKTLVITHRVSIRTHWESEIYKALGVRAGIIGSSQFNTDPPIVVGNTQTLYKHRDTVAKMFGTVIIDEAHHIPANTFSKLIDSSYARYKIGLSGTMDRKDGLHILIPDYFGPTRFSPPAENYVKPRVDIIKSEIRFIDSGNMPWALRINSLTRQEEYGKLVAMLGAIYRKNGHTVLILSDRKNFLLRLHETLGDTSRLIMGTTSLDQRKAIQDEILRGDARILLGTQSIFSEGISLNSLSCLILGTPVNNDPLLEQLIGRIVREHPGKMQPVVVDINLVGRTAEKQAQIRLGHYMKKGYNITTIPM